MDLPSASGHRPAMDTLDESSAEAEHIFAKRGCCFIPVSFLRPSSNSAGKSVWWQRIDPPAAPKPDSWWRSGLRLLMKVREWSELVAGPRWKTFIRRFGRGAGRSTAATGKFQYDPMSYARNFDEGRNDDSDEEYAQIRGFSARFASLPASTKSSMDLGGRDAPPLFTGWSGEKTGS